MQFGQKGSVDRWFSSRMLSDCRHPRGRAACGHTQTAPQRRAVRQSRWCSPLAAPTRDDDGERGVQHIASRLAVACSSLGMLERFIFHEKRLMQTTLRSTVVHFSQMYLCFVKNRCSPFGNSLRFARLVCEVHDVLVCFKT